MTKMTRLCLLTILMAGFVATPVLAAPPEKPSDRPVGATIETSLTTRDDHIPQFVFDNDASTYFASRENARKSDYFTLVFDAPVAVRRVNVITGRPDGSDRLEAGTLEVSPDGKTFREIATFEKGPSGVDREHNEDTRAVRIKVGADLAHPMVILSLAIASEPPVARFRYPIQFAVDTTDAPELKEWAEKTARTCERAYPMICDELKSDGFKPPHQVKMTLTKSYRGVAGTSGDRIVGSVAYFQRHRDDVGAMVHESVHVVQHYRGRGNPGWLVEGVSDYIRFFKFETREAGTHRSPARPVRRKLPRVGGIPGLPDREVRQADRSQAQSGDAGESLQGRDLQGADG